MGVNLTSATADERSPTAAAPTIDTDLESVFKALADSTRCKILSLLRERGLAVNDIVRQFDLTQPSISRHLAVLKAAGLVVDKRRGQRVIYRLESPESIDAARRYLELLTRHDGQPL